MEQPTDDVPKGKEPKVKRERTQQQREAFERCLAAREAAVLAKHAAKKEGGAPTPSPAPPTPAPALAEPTPPEPVSTPVSTPGADMDVADDDDDYDYITFDMDQYDSHVNSTKAELKAMREELDRLRNDHSELHGTFQEHRITSRNQLNFC